MAFAIEQFRFEKLLKEDARRCRVALLGSYGTDSDSAPAILIAEKTHFDVEAANQLAPSLDAVRIQNNDVYTLLQGTFKPENRVSDVKMTLITPATDAHIRKYSAQPGKLVRETPEMYKTIVLPFIQSFPPSRIQWVYNILEHKKESETILYEDPDPESGFIILPDLKWDRTQPQTMYLMAIVHNRKLRSLRDLSSVHLPLLVAIRAAAHKTAAQFGVAEGEVRCFVHYQPSYYHFHVHITHVDYESPSITRAIHVPIEDIIDSISLSQDQEARLGPYYQRRTLTYGIGTEHGLFEGLWQANQA